MLQAKDIPFGLADKSIYGIYDNVANNFKDGSTFVELGCFSGQSTIYLAQASSKLNRKHLIYAIDIWQNVVPSYRGAINVSGSIFKEFWGNVIKAEVEQYIYPIQFDSSRAAQMFADRSVDFVFVDADHSYNKCWDDIVSWLPKLKLYGWMGGHDYNQEVEKCVNKIFGKTNVQVLTGGAMSWLVKFG